MHHIDTIIAGIWIAAFLVCLFFIAFNEIKTGIQEGDNCPFCKHTYESHGFYGCSTVTATDNGYPAKTCRCPLTQASIDNVLYGQPLKEAMDDAGGLKQ